MKKSKFEQRQIFPYDIAMEEFFRSKSHPNLKSFV